MKHHPRSFADSVPPAFPGNRRKAIFASSLLALALTFAASSAHATSATWNTGTSGLTWSTGANWNPTAAPGQLTSAGITNADTATFNQTTGAALSILLDAPWNIKNLTFAALTTTKYTIGTLGGNAFTLTSGGAITVSSTGTTVETINAPLILTGASGGTTGGGTYSIVTTVANNPVFGGAITSDSSGTTGTNTLSVDTGANNEIILLSGNITDGSNGTKTALTKVDAANTFTYVLQLSGTNTYSGTTTINGGFLRADQGVGISPNSNLILNGSGTFSNSNPAALNLTANFTEALGSGAGQIQVLGYSGFTVSNGGGSASTINLGGAGATVQWGSTFFNPTTLAINSSVKSAGTITFANPIDLNGTTRTIDGGGAGILSGAISDSTNTGAGIIKVGIGATTLTATPTFTGSITVNNGTVGLTMSGNTIGNNIVNGYSNGAAAGSTSTIRVIGNGTLSGTISNPTSGNAFALGLGTVGESVLETGIISGAGDFYSTGTGGTSGTTTTILAGANTYTGKTGIVSGALVVSSLGHVGGSASNLGIPASGKDTIMINVNNTINQAGLVYIGTGESSNRPISTTGNVTGVSSIINNGSGALVLSGGLTSVNVTAGGNSGFRLGGANTGNNTISGAITNSTASTATTALIKLDAGTWILTAANTYTLGTQVTGGTLLLDANAGGSLTGTSMPLSFGGTVAGATVGGGGNFQIKGASGGTSQTIGGAFSLNGDSSSRITLDPNNGTGVTLTLGNAWTRNAGSSILFDYSSANTGTRIAKTSGTITGTGAAVNSILGYALVTDSSGVTGFAKQDGSFNIVRYDDTTGTVLSTANATGSTGTTNFTTLNSTYSSGTLTLGTANPVLNTLTIDTSGTSGTLNLATAGVVFLSSTGVLFKGSNNETVTGGELGQSGFETIIHQTAPLGGGVLTINSIISSPTVSPTAGVLTKDGTGLLVLGGSNAYTGITNINGGVLRATSGTGLPTASTLYINNGVFESGADITRNLGAASVSGVGSILISGGTSGFSANGAAINVSIGGSGTETSLVWGVTPNAAVAAASGTTAPTLGTYFNPSILVLNESTANNTLNFKNPIDLNGATRAINVNASSSFPATMSGVISSALQGGISAGITKGGVGKLILTAANTYTGPTTVTAGTLALSGSGTFGTGSLTTSGGTIDLGTKSITNALGSLTGGGIVQNGTITNNSGTYDMQSGTVSAVLNGSNVLSKTTGGTVTLSGANGYTGATTVSAGTLALSGSGTLGTNSVTVSGGTLDLGGASITNTLGALTGGGTVANGTITNNSGNFDLQNGTVSASLSGSNGLNKTTSNTVTLSGTGGFSGLTNITAGTLAYGASNVIGSGAVTVNGATAILAMGSNHSDTVGTVTVDGGASITGSGTSALTSTGTFEMKNGSVSAGLAGSGIALNKTTSGTATLSGSNSYTGTTTVTLGTLVVASSGALGGGGAVSIASGGTLQNGSGGSFTFNQNVANNGTIDADGNNVVIASGKTLSGTGLLTDSLGVATFEVAGTLSPGNSPGTVTVDTFTTLTLDAGATTIWQLNAEKADGTIPAGVPGTNWDNIVMNGSSAVNLDGTLQIALDGISFSNDPYWESNHTYAFVGGTTAGLSGNFTSFSGNNSYTNADGTGTFGTSPDGTTITYDWVAVPEPQTWALAAMGLSAVLFRLRRKQRN